MPVKSLVVQIIVSHADESHFYRSKNTNIDFYLKSQSLISVNQLKISGLILNLKANEKTKECIGLNW